MKRYVDYWRRREAERQMQGRRLACQARADLERIVDALVCQFGAKRIILFGSLVRARFAPGSDMDLAVEGIARDAFFAALAQVNRLTPLWVDLKPLEDLEPHFFSAYWRQESVSMRQKSASEIRELALDIDIELEHLTRLESEIRQVQAEIQHDPGRTALFYENLALKLRNFYTGCERVFQLIASELNGALPSTYDWHKRLLGRMRVEDASQQG